MGFSVSGSAAIIFVGMFIAFGMWHTAATNGFERVTDAQQDRTEDMLAQQNTAIEIQTASYTTESHNDQTWYLIDLEVDNTGSTTLSLADTDLLMDNNFQTNWEDSATVDGDPATDLWLSGETATAEFNQTYLPDRVTVVTETGVSDSTGVSSA